MASPRAPKSPRFDQRLNSRDEFGNPIVESHKKAIALKLPPLALGFASRDERSLSPFSSARTCSLLLPASGPGWLPNDFRTKHRLASARLKSLDRRPARKVGSESMLPSPLAQVIDLLPQSVAPSEIKIHECVLSEQPAKCFASCLVPSAHLQELQSQSCWDSEQDSLCLWPDRSDGSIGAPINASVLGAATALYHESCQRLSLGNLVKGVDLSMLCYWKQLRQLTLHDAEALPCVAYLPSSVRRLCIILTEQCSRPRVISAGNGKELVFSSGLRELRISGGPASGLASAVQKAEGLRFVDCSFWNDAPAGDLLAVAAMMIKRGGLFAWPSSQALVETLVHSRRYGINRTHILEAASRATAYVLESTCSLVREHALGPSDAIAALTRAVRYGKEMRVDFEELQKIEAQIMRIQAEMVMNAADSETQKRLGGMFATGRTESKEQHAIANRWARHRLLFAALGTTRPDGVDLATAEEALGSLGFAPDECVSLLQSLDCESRGSVMLADVQSVLERPTPATAEELYRFYVSVKNHWGSLDEAFEALDTKRDRFLTLEEFDEGIHRACKVGLECTGVPSRAIFAALDAYRASGMVDHEEFGLLSFFANVHRMHCVERIYKFLLNQFGSLESAFPELDANNSGRVSKGELSDALRKLDCPWSAASDEAMKFIDRNGDDCVSVQDMAFLDKLTTDNFLTSLKTLHRKLITDHGSLQHAFLKMDLAKDGVISYSEFLGGCRRVSLEDHLSELDVRTLFLFLDDSHDCCIQSAEWNRLNCFNANAAQQRLQDSVARLSKLCDGNPRAAFDLLSHGADAGNHI